MSKRRHKKHEGGHENAERWLLTYADLITLLMVFFVVLYSMSQADSEKFRRISASLEKAFNVDVMDGSANTAIMDGSPAPASPVDDLISDAEVSQVQRLKSRIELAMDDAGQQPEVSVGTDKDGVVVRLSGSYLFDSGRAELKPNSLAVLDVIAAEIKPLQNQIRIDGHTDSTPIESPRYPTNWELSTARATAVTRYFSEVSGISATRIMAAGYGEFRPLVPNDSREHRAQNRRVEIHLLSTAPPQQPTASTTAVESASVPRSLITENEHP